MNDIEKIVFLVNYSTADFEKTLSAENDPAYTDASIATIFFPPGEYRIIAGKLMRVVKELPSGEFSKNFPATESTGNRVITRG